MEKKEIELAKLFHDTYERLAPEFGYITREDTKEFDENSSNGKLMIAVCKEVMTGELDKAREEGRRENKQEISGYFSKTEGEHILERGKEYVVISRELYDKLSKLKDSNMKKKELKEWLADKIGDLMTLYDQYLDESTIYCGADFYGAKVYKYKEKEMLDFILQEINKAREGEKQNGWEECEAFYGDMRKILRPYHKEGEDYRNTLKRLLSKLKE